MAKKIYRQMLLLALLAVVLTSALNIGALYDSFTGRLEDELRVHAVSVAVALDETEDKAAYLDKLYRAERDDTRITWIAADGTVLYDSAADVSNLENHSDREEFAEALEKGRGESRRMSATLSENTVNYAVLLNDGSVIRLSGAQKTVWGLVWGMASVFAAIVAAVAIVASIWAKTVTAKLVAPINQIDPEEPETIETYDELAPMVTRLRVQNIRIDEQLKDLKRRQDEFAAVTDNMREGLVLTDSLGHILFVNSRAARLFNADPEGSKGRHLLTVNRSHAIKSAYYAARAGASAEELFNLNGRVYQILANPVLKNFETVGTVLLVVDVTERRMAEEQRREFSANVSHELKTPLQSISGYAELMKDGIAKVEDTRDFSQRIYDESQRLIALVDDIMRLSGLDEGNVTAERESTDLLELCREAARVIEPKAQKMSVSITVTGESAEVFCIRPLLFEMLTNLIDNAVKYNKEQGSVKVTVKNENGRPSAEVSDTGIGIPVELQEKVFERFYRVDKSHSKEIGGTGLGLSIVKHGAALHNAAIAVDSRPGEGTAIKLTF